MFRLYPKLAAAGGGHAWIGRQLLRATSSIGEADGVGDSRNQRIHRDADGVGQEAPETARRLRRRAV